MSDSIICRRNLLVWCGLVVTICLICSSCYYHRYYEVPHETQEVAVGRVGFGIGKIDGLICASKDDDSNHTQGSIYSNPSYATFEMDSNTTYYAIYINLWPQNLEYDSVSMRADSLVIQLDGCEAEGLTALFPQTVRRGSLVGAAHDRISVEPIGIPAEYKGDFTVSFRLSFYNETTGELIETIPVVLRSVLKKELIHPLNLPAAS